MSASQEGSPSLEVSVVTLPDLARIIARAFKRRAPGRRSPILSGTLCIPRSFGLKV